MGDETVDVKKLRLNFLYAIFDDNNNMEVTRLEFRNGITGFLEFALQFEFDDDKLQDKVEYLVTESGSEEIFEKTIDYLVDQMFEKYSFNGEIVTFEEWQNWFTSFDGIDEVIDFSDILRSG